MQYKEGWDADHLNHHEDFSETTQFALWFWDFLKDKPAKTLLDVACGNGRDMAFFRSKGLRVTGIDGSEVAIGFCKKKNLNATLHDLENPLNLPANSFDVVYSHLGLHYFSDRRIRELFEELKNALKPGGFFCFRCRSTKDTKYIDGERVKENFYMKDSHPMHLFSSDYIDELLQGFSILKKGEYLQEGPELKKYGSNFSFKVIAQNQ